MSAGGAEGDGGSAKLCVSLRTLFEVDIIVVVIEIEAGS